MHTQAVTPAVLVADHLDLVEEVASRHQSHARHDVLVVVLDHALVRAAHAWDCSRGIAFSAFARMALHRAVIDWRRSAASQRQALGRMAEDSTHEEDHVESFWRTEQRRWAESRISMLLGQLPATQANLIRWAHGLGGYSRHTVSQIAGRLGVTIGSAKYQLRVARRAFHQLCIQQVRESEL